MKKLLLLCSALALAGCNSAPGTGDVEKFLEPKFASCQNIEITDIKKTNGYEDEGNYRVEFTYDIKLKDPSVLKDFLETYEHEKASMLAWQAATEARKKQLNSLENEIRKIYQDYEAQGPQRHQFSSDGSPYPSPEGLKAYFAAAEQWKRQNPPPSAWQEKQDELAQLYADGPQVQKPELQYFMKADTAVQNHYLKGCPSGTYMKFMRGIFDAPRLAVQNNQDPRYWFQEYETNMQGSVTMRKTEKGWRALSEG